MSLYKQIQISKAHMDTLRGYYKYCLDHYGIDSIEHQQAKQDYLKANRELNQLHEKYLVQWRGR